MITLIIGHRGTGKSTLLKKLKKYFADAQKPVKLLDLDHEIAHDQKKTIDQIFTDSGEPHFRSLELEMLNKLVHGNQETLIPTFIAVGAGFPGPFPEGAQILWVRRPTDSHGRTFFDRPPLENGMSPYEGYQKRFIDREYFYSQVCDEQLMLLEGYDYPVPWEETFLGLGKEAIGGNITLFDSDLMRFSGAEIFLARRVQWGVDRFELRDDLLEDGLIRYAMSIVPKSKLLFSFRAHQNEFLTSLIGEGIYYDWPMEKGPCPFGVPQVFSLHEKIGNFQDTLLRFEERSQAGSHLKLAIEVDNWEELLEGHFWWQEDVQNRTFLPRSKDGRWRWYRTLFGKQMRLSFFKESRGSAPDQPYFAEWVRAMRYFAQFGAVLGNPVEHSLSPVEHQKFFDKLKMPFVAIPMNPGEPFANQLDALKKMGLKAAAVTSPFKQSALQVCGQVQSRASEVNAVNTLMFRENGNAWIGANSDIDGLTLMKDLEPIFGDGETMVIWGGGGTREAIQMVFPKAQAYSARAAAPVIKSSPVDEPEVLVWAVGRSRQSQCKWPNPKWKPKYVFDLNYTLDSPGREYALKVGAEYISGQTMFQAQAMSQQVFWKQNGI